MQHAVVSVSRASCRRCTGMRLSWSHQREPPNPPRSRGSWLPYTLRLLSTHHCLPCWHAVQVDHGYSKLVSSAQSMGKMILLLLWASKTHAILVPVFILIPLFMYVRVRTAERTATTLRLKYFKSQHQMVTFAEDIARNMELVRDHHQQPAMSRRFATIINDVNYFFNAVWSHTTQEKGILPMITATLTGLMMLSAPHLLVKATPFRLVSGTSSRLSHAIPARSCLLHRYAIRWLTCSCMR